MLSSSLQLNPKIKLLTLALSSDFCLGQPQNRFAGPYITNIQICVNVYLYTIRIGYMLLYIYIFYNFRFIDYLLSTQATLRTRFTIFTCKLARVILLPPEQMVLYVIEEERYADIWDTTRCSTQWMERSNCRNCLSGQRATRYPERFARIDGSNCSTVLSTLDCFQTQLPSAAAAATAEENKRG